MSSTAESVRIRRKFPMRGCLLALLGIAIIGLVVWELFTYTDNVTPQITGIPLLTPGQTSVQILGNHFGTQTDKVWLINVEDSTRQAADIISWQNNKIIVQLPAGISHGSLQVEQGTPIGSRSSSIHEFITFRPRSDQPQTGQVPTQPGSPWPTSRKLP